MMNEKMPPFIQDISDLRRERDEARHARDEALKLTDRYAKMIDTLQNERDTYRALLQRLATASKPVADRLWATGESQPAEVIRLGEAAQEAMAELGEGRGERVRHATQQQRDVAEQERNELYARLEAMTDPHFFDDIIQLVYAVQCEPGCVHERDAADRVMKKIQEWEV